MNDFELKLMILNPTYKCNLNCIMCGQRKMDLKDLQQELSIDKIKESVLECKKHKLTYGVYLWGGEPFLYSQIDELINFLEEKHVFLTINTNGMLLNKHFEQILRNRYYLRMIISLDGIGEVHNKIRGNKNAYEIIRSNIEYLVANKKKNLVISTNTVITSENYGSLFNVIDSISELGVDFMEAQLPIFFSDECGARYEEQLKKYLQTVPKRWTGFRGSYSEVDVNALGEELAGIKEKFGSRFRLSPNVSNEMLETYFIDPDSINKDKVCSLPFSHIIIEPNGDVVTCPDFPDCVVGNIHDSSIDDIYYSERNRMFRDMLKEERLSICSRCCQFYIF